MEENDDIAEENDDLNDSYTTKECKVCNDLVPNKSFKMHKGMYL